MEDIKIRNTLLSYISRAHHMGGAYVEILLKKKGIKNLGHSHIRIIIILSVYKRVSMKEISEMISKDKSTVTTLVKKLEKLKYVKKSVCRKDRRITFLELEERAEEIIETVFQVAGLFQRKVESILTKEEIDNLFFIMEKLVKNF
ncbi:transcriptional regulator SlyA [Fusobacterium necrogenes]|uniref:Transcriptional regulator SlyA n=1 Tax=Fusobacterium necrogenes TaxID=858 RepID=A0A377GWC4_9FUSO|nr:MarR family transcriptional regulator [Fusobacterium necrogenes]STO31259.1 transcriptional regulator SlyA [Fusobacterium necrogenes]